MDSSPDTTHEQRQPARILLAENDTRLAAAVAELLASEGYEVFHTSRGRWVLPLTLAHQPDVLLLDLLLGDSHGFDVLSSLQSHPATLGIPVIVLTGYARQLLPSGGRGTFAVLQKPFGADELLCAITAATRSHPDLEPAGSLDGDGAADCDVPYVFGRPPRALAPFPFSELQFARLLVLRSTVRDHASGREEPREGTQLQSTTD